MNILAEPATAPSSPRAPIEDAHHPRIDLRGHVWFGFSRKRKYLRYGCPAPGMPKSAAEALQQRQIDHGRTGQTEDWRQAIGYTEQVDARRARDGPVGAR